MYSSYIIIHFSGETFLNKRIGWSRKHGEWIETRWYGTQTTSRRLPDGIGLTFNRSKCVSQSINLGANTKQVAFRWSGILGRSHLAKQECFDEIELLSNLTDQRVYVSNTWWWWVKLKITDRQYFYIIVYNLNFRG